MNNYVTALKWPVITWIVLDLYLLAVSYIEGVLDLVTTPAVAPLLVAVGAWAGYRTVGLSGKALDAVIAGLVVGIVCGGGGFLLFSYVRGLGASTVLPSSIMDFSLSLGGAVVGGWYVLSQAEARSGA